ncbi:hypothetical protein B0H14DRAFT_2690333, partial [Mycena olivaceomarginata]
KCGAASYHLTLFRIHAPLNITMAPVSTSSSSYYSTPTGFPTEAVYVGAAMTDDLSPNRRLSTIRQQHLTPACTNSLSMVILAAGLLLFCAYILGKTYLGKCSSPHAHEAFRPPLPTPTPTGNRSDPWLSHRQMRPVYISQADMLSSGKGFFE